MSRWSLLTVLSCTGTGLGSVLPEDTCSSTLDAPHFCGGELVPPQRRAAALAPSLPQAGAPGSNLPYGSFFFGAWREHLQPYFSSSLGPPALKSAFTGVLPDPLPSWHFGAQWGITPMPEGSLAAPGCCPTVHAQCRAQAPANRALAQELFGCLRLN